MSAGSGSRARWYTDDDGQPVALEMFTMDITERKQAEETIRRLAYHDSLTGLPNRALFEDRLRMALAQARRQGEMWACCSSMSTASSW